MIGEAAREDRGGRRDVERTDVPAQANARFEDAERFERVERFPGHDPAAAKDGSELALARELVAGLQPLLGDEPSQVGFGRLGLGRRDEEIEDRLPIDDCGGLLLHTCWLRYLAEDSGATCIQACAPV